MYAHSRCLSMDFCRLLLRRARCEQGDDVVEDWRKRKVRQTHVSQRHALTTVVVASQYEPGSEALVTVAATIDTALRPFALQCFTRTRGQRSTRSDNDLVSKILRDAVVAGQWIRTSEAVTPLELDILRQFLLPRWKGEAKGLPVHGEATLMNFTCSVS